MSLGRCISWLAVFFLCFAAAVASSQPILNGDADRQGDDTGILPEPYAGVVMNQTITVVGQDFYQNFMTAWRDKELSERYSLSIHERPSARSGSQVWIEFAQRRVFQANLPPSRSAVKAMSEQAVEIAYQNIVDAEVQRLVFKDDDLAADEF
jgi:curli production assembly/transport component CsgE